MNFTRAIVRPPGRSYSSGLTSSREGPPELSLALRQHAAYCAALEDCGLAVTTLAADEAHPDGTFVEDTAIVTAHGAVLTRPGAASRAGEVRAIAAALRNFYPEMPEIEPPGTVDGGDICEAEHHFFIGLSARTNAEGARQLAGYLGELGYRSSQIDIRASATLLHLKTGMAYLGDGRILVTADVPADEELADFELVLVPAGEEYAANCVRVNERLLVPGGCPRTAAALVELGYRPLALQMSEFRKMDGGLSCLSLRF
jgi:dimethylargininase